MSAGQTGLGHTVSILSTAVTVLQFARQPLFRSGNQMSVGQTVFDQMTWNLSTTVAASQFVRTASIFFRVGFQMSVGQMFFDHKMRNLSTAVAVLQFAKTESFFLEAVAKCLSAKHFLTKSCVTYLPQWQCCSFYHISKIKI